MSDDYHRGHPIVLNELTGRWLYVDTMRPVEDDKNISCGHCGKTNTPEGHDGCLGTLPLGVMNACCGHGRDSEAYIQFTDGVDVSGKQAREMQKAMVRSGDVPGTVWRFGA